MEKVTVSDLCEMYKKVYENGKELLEEAEILLKHKRYARSFTLSQLASEEFSKLPTIYSIATEVNAGLEFDGEKMDKRFRDHKSKSRMLFMLKHFVEGNITPTVQEIREIEKGAKMFNDMKNQSLYAGFYDNEFTKPKDVVTKEFAESHLEIATTYFENVKSGKFHYKQHMIKSLENGSMNRLAALRNFVESSYNRSFSKKDESNHHSKKRKGKGKRRKYGHKNGTKK